MNNCPNCNEKVVTVFEKFMMGSARNKTCSKCGAKFSVQLWPSVLFLFSVAPIIGVYVLKPEYVWEVFGVMCVVVLLSHMLAPLRLMSK